MMTTKWILPLLLSVAMVPAADEQTKARPAMLRFTAEWYAMPGDTCSNLLGKNRDGGDTGLREETRALVARGEATLSDLVSGTTFPGAPIRVQSVQELIHATEVNSDIMRLQTEPPDVSEALRFIAPNPISSFVPLAYETKELGSSVEADVALRQDGRTITATVFPLWSALTRWESLGKYKDANAEVEMRMPRISNLRIKSQFLLTDGVPMLVGVFSQSAPDGATDPARKILLFLRVDVLRLPE